MATTTTEPVPVAPPTAAAPRRRRSGIHGSVLTPYLFLAPFLFLFVCFVLVPGVFGIWISLHDWDFLLPGKPFVGLQNYADLFDSSSVQYGAFWASMRATAIFVVGSVPFLVVLPLLLAIALNRSFPGRTFFRAVFFAPFVLGVAVVGLMWRYLLDPSFGLVNGMLGAIGLPDDIPWTTDQPWAWISLIGVTVWWTVGFNAVIYLAGLADIPAEHYEAAELDGVNAWQRLRYITLPALRPVLIFVVVTTFLASANMFGQSYLLTQGGPGDSTRTAIITITELGLTQFRMGQASAMSYVLALFLCLVSLLNFWALRERR
ncbi:ABC transporter permease subunit [Janibacter melonis]|uniref:ABC transporter permease subunit n=1 Tax=Janibacter melonis TaxID=262209 RepID=A0A5P8FKN0_9MICO|nr:sugar ABC transporter permease [Janibacter melonis]MCB5990080.1 sugar ABC transporter permease [Janibacter melonis]QFQ30097.2 ABC transporter permease subunit [Janibacter melonis]